MFRIELALGLSYLTISPNLLKSTGLVVMGGDSHAVRIPALDPGWPFFSHYVVVKVECLFEKDRQ